MPIEKYKVELTEEEIKLLKEITHNGSGNSAKAIMHANVLLNTNDLNALKQTDRQCLKINFTKLAK